ncbi:MULTISPECIES: DUF6174 domain-containing protein [unclassified Blastococcus]
MGRPGTGAALLLAVVASGCAAAGGSAGPAGTTSAAASSAPSWTAWEEPADYRFTLESSCGERNVLGVYRVTVRGGEVVAADHDDRLTGATVVLGPDDLRQLPTLGDLLDEARAADGDPRAGEVAVRTDPADGHPTSVAVDPVEQGIDDESCYVVTDYAPGA